MKDALSVLHTFCVICVSIRSCELATEDLRRRIPQLASILAGQHHPWHLKGMVQCRVAVCPMEGKKRTGALCTGGAHACERSEHRNTGSTGAEER